MEVIKFSINLRFKSNFQKKIYSYSIIFDDENSISIEPFFHKNIIRLNEKDEQEIRRHLEWIDKTFNINSKTLLNEQQHPYWVINFKL